MSKGIFSKNDIGRNFNPKVLSLTLNTRRVNALYTNYYGIIFSIDKVLLLLNNILNHINKIKNISLFKEKALINAAIRNFYNKSC